MRTTEQHYTHGIPSQKVRFHVISIFIRFIHLQSSPPFLSLHTSFPLFTYLLFLYLSPPIPLHYLSFHFPHFLSTFSSLVLVVRHPTYSSPMPISYRCPVYLSLMSISILFFSLLFSTFFLSLMSSFLTRLSISSQLFLPNYQPWPFSDTPFPCL